jgi:hypothetical protein
MRIVLVIVLVLGALGAQAFVGQSKSKARTEQSTFCEEGASENDVLRPTPLPPIVLETIMNTAEGKEAHELLSGEGKELDPETVLKGTNVHLTDSHLHFFLVMGLPPMSGADNTWFWIVRLSENKATILLFTGAICIDIGRTSTSGYRDVVTTWSSPSTTVTETYKYNGSSYKSWRRKSRPVSYR